MKTNTLKIALLGPFGFGNLGDAAIQQAMIYNARKVSNQLEIYGVSLNPDDTEKRHGIRCFPISRKPSERLDGSDQSIATPTHRKFLKARHLIFRLFLEIVIIIRSMKNISGFHHLIISGGGQLDDYFGGPLSHPYTLLKWTLCALLGGAKVHFVSVGAGPINSKLSFLLIKTALALATSRSFRDQDSKRFIAKLGFNRGDPVFPDLAHSIDAPFQTPSSEDGLVIGVGPMTYFKPGCWPEYDEKVYQTYMEKLTEFIQWLHGQNASIRLFPGEVGADRPAIDQLKSRFHKNDRDRFIIDNQIETVDELLAELASTTFVIASRFHGVLLSHVTRKPVIALSYHRKVSNLMKDMGHEEYCLDINTFSADELIEKFKKMQKNKDQLQHQIELKEMSYQAALTRQYKDLFTSQNNDMILTPFCRQGEKPVSSLKGELAWKRRNAERNTIGSSRSMP